MIEHLVARGAHVLFNSNAISLSRAQATALIDAGLPELRVSPDASTRETYARVRGADALDNVLANLQRLRHVKRDRGAARPRGSLRATVMKGKIEGTPGPV